MPFLPSESRLFERLYGEPALAELFRDERWVGFLLEVEVALAKVQGELGIIPPGAAAAIGALRGFTPDWEALARQTERDGVPITALVAQLREALGSEHGPYLHWGATTQDILDTAFVLQARTALGLLEAKLRRSLRALADLARRHRHTLMAGRTHAQQALPITFGFKVAGWMAPLLRDLKRLEELKRRLLVVQLGGAVGTLAALGGEGLRVMEGLARELGLGTPPIPWHTARDNLAELAGWLSLLTGSLAKMAQDVILLAQSEVGEVAESAETDRGGSSTLPQKSNPVRSEVILASARANAALLSAVHQALVAEHERATHAWQLEWLTLPQMFAHTAAALHQACALSEGMVVNGEGMRANLRASRGLMLAEALSFALAEHMDRAQAKELVREAARVARSEGRHLLEVLRERVGLPIRWEAFREEDYLGSSQPLIEGVLQEAERVLSEVSS
jgi:3-carboxy-cis,cis-muconate cycloisomerase